MLMLNLRFDTTQTNGIFDDVTGNPQPLSASKEWLNAPDPSPWPANFNPSSYTWGDSGPDHSLTVRGSANPGNILVRVFSLNAPTGTTVRLTVVFGRLNRGSNVATPFTLNQQSGGAACTVFASDYNAAAADGSWVWKLGPVVTFPAQSNGANKYEFVVGITVVQPNGTVLTFGHDPEMDVEN